MAGVVHFDIKTPRTEAVVRRQIARSRALGLREAFETEPEGLTIIANGPSAWHAPHAGPTLALNNALRVIPNPTYWAGCDPQEDLADFVKDGPKDTIYYVASKCHPKVFRALKDRDVRLWHVGDFVPGAVPSAVSITLTAMNLFARLGWRKFDVWGWDTSFGPGGEHHAGDEPFSPNPNIVEVAIDGGPTFKTTPTWAAEAQDAHYIIPLLEYLGCEINIHGNSMVEAIRRFHKAA